MALLPLPLNAITQVTFFGTLADQRIMNTFHFQFQGTPSPSIDYRTYYTALGDELKAVGGMKDKYLDIIPQNMTFNYMHIQTIWPVRQRYVYVTVGELGTSDAGNASTANIAFSIRRVSDIIGQAGVGRVQIPVGSNWMDVGKLALAALPDVTAFTPYMTEVTTTAAPDAEWLPVLFGVHDGGVVSVSEIIESYPEDTLRTMHRRTVRLGE